ncbi:MAG: hypothetical protein LBN95_02210 [Prevotellaceae bacterium]|jgi:hypothetical protein|nr:hypothetical protein [Prevotellaceae bacterium]
MEKGKTFHIGNIICNQLQKEGRTKKWLAEQVHCNPSCLCKTLKKSSFDLHLLQRISFAMYHDFAKYLTDYYNENAEKRQNNGK